MTKCSGSPEPWRASHLSHARSAQPEPTPRAISPATAKKLHARVLAARSGTQSIQRATQGTQKSGTIRKAALGCVSAVLRSSRSENS